MKISNICIGTIKKCTKYTFKKETVRGRDICSAAIIEHEVYKEHAILIKLKTGKYVDIDEIRKLIDYYNIYMNEAAFTPIDYRPTKEGDLFVDAVSRFSNPKVKGKKIGIRKLKKITKKRN